MQAFGQNSSETLNHAYPELSYQWPDYCEKNLTANRDTEIDWTPTIYVMDKRDFTRFEFTISIRPIFYIATVPDFHLQVGLR